MKKIFSVIVIFSVLLGSISVGADAEEKNGDTFYNSAEAFITSIYPELQLENEIVTRAEFVKVLMDILNLSLGEENGTAFSDVSKSHSAYFAILTAKNMGLISQNTLFYPDEPITKAQAAKIAVTLLGYAHRAEGKGGYPDGYIAEAMRLDLFDNCDSTQFDRRNFMIFLKNTLLCDARDLVSLGTEAVYLETYENRTLLSIYRDIESAEGIVTADEFTGLYSIDERAAEGCVRINNEEYLCTDDILGHNVRIYYIDGEAGKKVVYSEKIYNDITETLLSKSEYRNGKLYSEYNGKIQNMKTEEDVAVIYNGKAANYPLSNYIKDSDGYIQLVDNDRNGYADVINIYDVKYVVVSDIDYFRKRIYDRNTQSVIDLSDDKCRFTVREFYNNQEYPSDFSLIEKESVLAVCSSEDRNKVEIIVCYEAVYGAVTALSKEEKEIEIDSVTYTLSKYFNDNYYNIELGMKAAFMIGNDGRIVSAEIESSAYRYGYAYAIGTTAALTGKSVKILDQSGEMRIYKIDKYVRADGERINRASAETLFENIIASEDEKRIIRYKATEDGLLNAVDTAADMDLAEDYLHTKYDMDNSLIKCISGKFQCKDDQIFGTRFHLGGSVNFLIPDKSSSDRDDEEEYRVVPDSYFYKDTTYNITAYDLDSSYRAKTTLVKIDEKGQKNVPHDTVAGIVSKVYYAKNTDGNITRAIDVWRKGYFNTYYSEEGKSDFSALSPGDIVRITVDDDRNVKGMLIDYSFRDDEIADGISSDGGRIEYVTGTVVSVNSGFITVKTSAAGSENMYRNIKITGAVAFVDVYGDTSKIDINVVNDENDSIEDILNSASFADKAVIRLRYYDPQLIVIYREE